jgi:hypothetical protein
LSVVLEVWESSLSCCAKGCTNRKAPMEVVTNEVETLQTLKDRGAERLVLTGGRQTMLTANILFLETWLTRGYGPDTPLLTEMVDFPGSGGSRSLSLANSSATGIGGSIQSMLCSFPADSYRRYDAPAIWAASFSPAAPLNESAQTLPGFRCPPARTSKERRRTRPPRPAGGPESIGACGATRRSSATVR